MSTTGNSTGHRPVMVEEVLRYLVTDPGGTYLDLTAGLGGHLMALAKVVAKEARLYGVDIDASAVAIARRSLGEITQVQSITEASYTDVEAIARSLGEDLFDGILLDLGISSLQIDLPERGFTYRTEAPLDMRFDPEKGGLTAADLINSLSEAELVRIIRDYGEERKARAISRSITAVRKKQEIMTSSQLSAVIEKVVSGNFLNKTLSRVYQAFRIAVNRELDRIQDVLPRAVSLLKEGGRIVVISYHSLEDRLIKNFFRDEARECICPPGLPVCLCGHKPCLEIITRRVVVPTDREIAENSRARSARLRAAQRIAV